MVEPQVGSLNILHYHHQLVFAVERGAGTAVRDIEHLLSHAVVGDLVYHQLHGSSLAMKAIRSLKNRCILLCSVGYIYVAQIPFSGFGGRKGTSSMGKMSILEVLRLRAHQRCVTR